MYRWELEDEAEQVLAGLPHVRPVLAGFLDALVIVDPAEYRREPDELVLVVQVQWLGE